MTIAQFLEYAQNEHGCELRELGAQMMGPRGEVHSFSLRRIHDDGTLRTASVPDLHYYSESLHPTICGMCRQLGIPIPEGVDRPRFGQPPREH